MRCRNSLPYRSATASNSPPRVPSYSMSISRSPRVATAIGEATTSLTMVDAAEERVDRRGVRGDGGEGRERRAQHGRRLEAVPRDEEDNPLVPIDPAVLQGALQGRDGRPSRRLGEDALRPREEPLGLDDLGVARGVRKAACAPHDLNRFMTGGGVADREALRDRVGSPHRTRPPVRGLETPDDRGAAGRLRPDEARRNPVQLADRLELADRLVDGREEEPGSERRHDDVGQLEAELLPRLEKERLRALRVVRPEVDVHEAPHATVRGEDSDPVRVVVRAIDGHDGRAVDPWEEELRLLEARGREHVAGQAGLRGGGPGGGRGISRGWAPHGPQPPLSRLRNRDGDRTVLERGRRVHRVVLDPQFPEPELRSEVVRAAERRVAGLEVDLRPLVEDREELPIPPQVPRPARNRVPRERLAHGVELVRNLERAEARLAHDEPRRRILGPALTTTKAPDVTHEEVPTARSAVGESRAK